MEIAVRNVHAEPSRVEPECRIEACWPLADRHHSHSAGVAPSLAAGAAPHGLAPRTHGRRVYAIADRNFDMLDKIRREKGLPRNATIDQIVGRPAMRMDLLSAIVLIVCVGIVCFGIGSVILTGKPL